MDEKGINDYWSYYNKKTLRLSARGLCVRISTHLLFNYFLIIFSVLGY